jgi:hypothetical protein
MAFPMLTDGYEAWKAVRAKKNLETKVSQPYLVNYLVHEYFFRQVYQRTSGQ